MESKVLEYLVSEIGDTSEYGIFDGRNRLVVNCGNDREYTARDYAKSLNSNSEIVCQDFTDVHEGSQLLTEFYKRGYRLLSHTTVEYDGAVINSIIMRREIGWENK